MKVVIKLVLASTQFRALYFELYLKSIWISIPNDPHIVHWLPSFALVEASVYIEDCTMQSTLQYLFVM